MKSVHVLTFSPAGSTEKISYTLAKSLEDHVIIHDLTSLQIPGHLFSAEDLVICAVPVYGGRAPALATERIKRFQGSQTPIILGAVYGNREYEDTLIELGDILESQGFIVIAAGAFIARHVFSSKIGEGRPNQEDLDEIRNLGEKILQKRKTESRPLSILSLLPGNRPYKETHPAPIAPQTRDGCIDCKLCAQKCPAEAIPIDHPDKTDADRCILCTRCIQICPVHVRFLPETFLNQVFQKLQKACNPQRKSEIFL